jgi:hypothetical protein
MSTAPATPKLTNFVATLRGWVNIQNKARLPDAVITSWVRMAEERINEELRVAEMVTVSQGTFTANGEALPDDFLELNYIKSVGDAFLSYKYCTPEEYFRQVNRPTTVPAYTVPSDYSNALGPNDMQPRMYTIIGNALYISPAADTNTGTQVEIGYMARLSPLNDDVVNADNTISYNGNWAYDRYTRLYTFAALALSAPYLVEDERYVTWETEATRLITLMNNRYRTTRMGKGPLRTNFRSFG